MSQGSDEWYDDPRATAGLSLYRVPRRVAGEEPARHRGAAARTLQRRRRRRRSRNARTSDGTYNDLTCPRMGSCRHAVRTQRAARARRSRHRQPDEPEPAPCQPRVADADDVSAGDDPQRARRSVDPVSWCTTGSSTRRARGRIPTTFPLGDSDPLARTPMRVPKTPAEAAESARFEAAAGLHQREHALVGRIAGLWQHPAVQASLRAGRMARCWSARADGWASIPSPAREITGFTENGWVGLSLLHARVCARAQRDLRSSSRSQSRTGMMSGCFSRRGW